MVVWWRYPGVYDPGLWAGYAPHTSIMRILRMREDTIFTGGNTNESADIGFAAPRKGCRGKLRRVRMGMKLLWTHLLSGLGL